MDKYPSHDRTTVQYFMLTRWNGINTRTINGKRPNYKCKFASIYLKKGIRLEMTREEFYGWCLSNWHIAEDIHKQGLTPSLDRIDEEGPYSLENIQIISRNENSRKKGLTGPNFVYANQKATKIKATHIKTGETFFGTRRELAKKLNMAFSSVTNCAGGLLESCKGYRFEYTEKIDSVLHKRVLKANKAIKRKYNYDQMVELWNEGLRIVEIAKIMGCHPNYVSNILHQKMKV